ncbi:MAG: hypothetical protein NT039_03375 [Candidatus Berkelbacteria bacterium]|nr:hypothetical protein [Candidatus Berkelbacteria bacterium]
MKEYFIEKGSDVNSQMLNLAPEEHSIFGSSVVGKVFHGKTPIAYIGGASIEAINKARDRRNGEDPIFTQIDEIGDKMFTATILLAPLNSDGQAGNWQISKIGEDRQGIEEDRIRAVIDARIERSREVEKNFLLENARKKLGEG